MRFYSRPEGAHRRPTGAIVAAATTSLPETVGGERNWDYRYSWIRDSSLTLEALYIGRARTRRRTSSRSLTSSAGGRHAHRFPDMYGSGEHDLSRARSRHLRGWRDSSPVRVGNGAGTRPSSTHTASSWARSHHREQLGDLHPEIQRFVADLADTARADGPSATRGSGRCAASRCTTCPRRFCAGAAARPRDRAGSGLGAYARGTSGRRARALREASSPCGWSEKPQARAGVRVRRARRRGAPDALVGFLPPTTSACARPSRRSARFHRGRPRSALPGQGGAQRRRALRRGGHVRGVLVLARLGARERREVERAEALYDQLRELRGGGRDGRAPQGDGGGEKGRGGGRQSTVAARGGRGGSGGRRGGGEGGLRVAIVERELVGGECDYWACIPSKTLLRPGEALRRRASAGRPRGRERRCPTRGRLRVARLHGGDYEDGAKAAYLEGSGHRGASRGAGRLAGPGSVEVDDETYRRPMS